MTRAQAEQFGHHWAEAGRVVRGEVWYGVVPR